MVQLPTDLPHRQIALDIVSKDAPHDCRLRFVDFKMGGPVGTASDTPIAIRAFPGDHFAGTRAPQLAAAVSLSNLGALIFGDYSLHLSEQMGLRVVGLWRRVVEEYGDAMARQLVEHNDLIGIHPGQAIGR